MRPGCGSRTFLAHSQHENVALIQIADLTGAYGVSFVLVTVNELVSELIDSQRRPRWRLPAGVTAVLLAATLVYGWHSLATDSPAAGTLRVAIVQANVTSKNGMSVAEQMRHLGTYAQLTREAAAQKPQLIVWPSSSLPGPISYWMIGLMVSDIAGRAGAPLHLDPQDTMGDLVPEGTEAPIQGATWYAAGRVGDGLAYRLPAGALAGQQAGDV